MKSKKKRAKERKRLSGKFIVGIFLPFHVGVVLTIFAALFLFSLSNQIINRGDNLTNIVREKEFKKTLPLILEAKYDVKSEFQLFLDNIAQLSEFYTINHKHLLHSNLNITDKLKVINKFSFNGVDENSIENFHSLYIKKNKNSEYLLTQMKWFISNTKKELNVEEDGDIIQQLYLVINLLPLLKTIIEITNDYYINSEISNQILIMFSNTELFFKYPIIYENIFGKDLINYSHLADCKTNNGEFPHYYYFKCRPYYSFLEKSLNSGKNISLTDVYKFVNENIGISICSQTNDILPDEKISFCHDMELTYIHDKLDNINNKLYGYVFLLKVGSETPIYYPNADSDYRNIVNMEFSIENEYYYDEISVFYKKLSLLIAEYKYNDSNHDVMSVEITKNNEKFNYTIFPIYFNVKNMTEPQHLMTLVYVYPFEKKNNNKSYINSIVCVSFIYLLMGAFLISLCKNLIISLAKNIVRPIKIIKDLIEQDFEITTIPNQEDKDYKSNYINDKNFNSNNYNSNNTINNNYNIENNNNNKNIDEKIPIQISNTQNMFHFTNTFDISDKENNYSKVNTCVESNNVLSVRGSMKTINPSPTTNNIVYTNSNILMFNNDSNKLYNNQFLQNDYEQNSSSDEDNNSDLSYEDEEIDKTRYRSDNIQKLFVKLIDLKNSFKCLEDKKLENNELSDFIFSQNIFSEINNHEASSICQSNISSLFIDKIQYDKAISHLLNSIKEINKKLFPPNLKKRVSKTNVVNNEIKLDAIKKKIKNENLFNRYLKLFYCYKQYFKIIKKKYRYGKYDELNNDTFFMSHHMKIYKLCLKEYIDITKMYGGNKDICAALLSQVDEKISFEIPTINDVSLNNNNEFNYYKSNNENNMNDKEKMISEIIEIFKEIDKLNKDKISLNNYNVIHLLNLLKYNADKVNAMDIPPSILIQNTNYLKGKFYLKCYAYEKAISFFEKVFEFGKIGDARFLMKSYKYLLKISNTYLDLVKNDIQFHSSYNKYKNEIKEDEQRKDILEKYIINLNNEMKKYKYIPKDICIIINIGNITSQTNILSINEKILNIKKILNNIFENIITYMDKISILEYKNNEPRFLLTHKDKTETNESKINSIIENIENFLVSNLQTNYTNMNSSNIGSMLGGTKGSLRMITPQILDKLRDDKNANCLFNSVEFCMNYLKMKQIENLKVNKNYENWYIFVTYDMNYEDISLLKQKPIDKYLFDESCKNDNLLIIFYENISAEKKSKLKNLIKFNKSNVISKEELSELKKIMGEKGEEQIVKYDLEKLKEIL